MHASDLSFKGSTEARSMYASLLVTIGAMSIAIVAPSSMSYFRKEFMDGDTLQEVKLPSELPPRLLSDYSNWCGGAATEPVVRTALSAFTFSQEEQALGKLQLAAAKAGIALLVMSEDNPEAGAFALMNPPKAEWEATDDDIVWVGHYPGETLRVGLVLSLIHI